MEGTGDSSTAETSASSSVPPTGSTAAASSSPSTSSGSESGSTTGSSTTEDSGLAGPGEGYWAPRAAMPTPRSEFKAAVIDGLVYVPGGYGGRSTLEIYDPVADTWAAGADLPEGRDHAASAALDGVVYVVGGVEGVTSTFAYDPEVDAWEVRARLPHARTAASAVAYDGALWLLGGNGIATEEELREILRYEAEGDTWTVAGMLTQPREHLSTVVYDGAFAALAGRFAGEFYRGGESFEPETAALGSFADMLELRSGFQAVVFEPWIFACGGEVFAPAPVTVAAMEYYDPEGESWEPAPELPVGVHGHAVAAVGDEVLVIGGSDFAGGVMNMGRVWAYVR